MNQKKVRQLAIYKISTIPIIFTVTKHINSSKNEMLVDIRGSQISLDSMSF